MNLPGWIRRAVCSLSLRARLTIVITLPMAVLMTTTALINARHEIHRTQQAMVANVQSIIDVLSQDFERILLLDDQAATVDLVDKIDAFHWIERIVVYDLQDRVTFVYRRAGIFPVSPPAVQPGMVDFSRSYLRMFAPLRSPTKQVGMAFVQCSTEQLRRQTGRAIWSTSIMGLGALVIGLGLALVLQRRVSRPIIELQRAEERFRSLLEAAPEAMIIVTQDGTIRLANKRAEEVFSYSHQEMIGQPVELLVPRRIRSEHPSLRAQYSANPTVRSLGRGMELRAVRKGGGEFPAEISLSPLHTNDGLLVSTVVRDITKRKQAEREREILHARFVKASRQAGMAEIAAGVLHNVGNVLNSVNVSASIAADKVRASRITGLAKAAELMEEHAEDLETFITKDQKGRQLPAYLTKLARHLTGEQESVLAELESLTKNIEHIKTIVSAQQSYAGISAAVEPISISELVEDALKMNMAQFEQHDIRVMREYTDLPPIEVEKQKLFQILVNLIRNAKHALIEHGESDSRLNLRTVMSGEEAVRIEVEDNGVGIAPKNVTKIFSHGFTTKKDGHGFGLHHSALSAKEMGGSLTVHSDGPGRGATFTIELPVRRERTRGDGNGHNHGPVFAKSGNDE